MQGVREENSEMSPGKQQMMVPTSFILALAFTTDKFSPTSVPLQIAGHPPWTEDVSLAGSITSLKTRLPYMFPVQIKYPITNCPLPTSSPAHGSCFTALTHT